MLNVTVAGSSAVQQSNNSITAGLISNQPNEMMSIEQAMASTSFFSPKVQPNNQNFGKLPTNSQIFLCCTVLGFDTRSFKPNQFPSRAKIDPLDEISFLFKV